MAEVPDIQHRNSLGYVIGSATDRSRSGGPFIVWGKRQDGTHVFIGDAARGGADQLHCECGSLLIARKGEIRAAHFAHKGNQKGRCDLAFVSALERFAVSAIEAEGRLSLPGMRDESIHQVTRLEPDSGIVRLRLKARADLDLYLTHKKAAKETWKEHQESIGVSAIIIDLRNHLNLTDRALRAGIVRHFQRIWLFNRKGAGDKKTHLPPASLPSRKVMAPPPVPMEIKLAESPPPQPTEEELIAKFRAELERDYGGGSDHSN